MPSLGSRKPTPAAVLAALALFVSLGGTGYAASAFAPHAHATATARPLTKQRVKHLIARYVTTHRDQLRGPAGANGAQGIQGIPGIPGAKGRDGLPGPGAKHIGADVLAGGGEQTIATVGPWSVSLKCQGFHTQATLSVKGPGTVAGTLWYANGNLAGTSSVVGVQPVGAGLSLFVDAGTQASETLFLQSGATHAQVNLVLSATYGDSFVDCKVAGDAIPVA